ncbi:MAG: hypothetical protein ACOWWO_13045 [Peptococcaceae bacterium]
MNKIEAQSFQISKKMKCNLCDRLEMVEQRLVIWHNNQVTGDLHLCKNCLVVMAKVIKGEEEIIEEWTPGGEGNGKSAAAG